MSCGNQLTMFGKAVGSHTDASLMDEGIKDEGGFSDISYQAYSITYEQYVEFLALARDIQKDQREYYKGRVDPDKEYRNLSFPEKGVRKLKNGINCYIPEPENSGQITFNYRGINTFGNENTNDNNKFRQDIIDGTKELKASNTCRTSARSILNYTLHYYQMFLPYLLLGLIIKQNWWMGSQPQIHFIFFHNHQIALK